MGVQALDLLQKKAAPSPFMDEAIQRVCDLAISRNVRLLVDAEEQAVQPGIENWTMKYQKYCNSQTPTISVGRGRGGGTTCSLSSHRKPIIKL